MNRRLRFNPILKKDVLINSRSAKMTIALTIINCILLLMVLITLTVSTSGDSSFTSYYSAIVQIFPVMAILELAVICMMIPIMTATSISGERERQTLEIVLTTPVRPIAIVLGKLLSAMATTLIYVVASIPIMSVAFVVGGVSWRLLLVYVGIVLYMDVFIGSIGIFYSSVKRTSVGATMATIATVVGIVGATAVIGAVLMASGYDYTLNTTRTGYINAAMTCFAINPVAWMANVYTNYLYNETVLTTSRSYGSYANFLIEHMSLISVVVNLAFSAAVLKLASVKMMTGKRKKKRDKARSTV